VAHRYVCAVPYLHDVRWLTVFVDIVLIGGAAGLCSPRTPRALSSAYIVAALMPGGPV